MGLFKLAKKASKVLLRKTRPFIAPTVAAFGGATAGEIAGQLVGAPTTRQLPVPRGAGLPPIPIGGSTLPARLTRQVAPGAVRVGDVFTMGGCPPGFHPAKDGSGRCVRNRRMNVMNPRAARRAIRRIKGARKMLQSIERQLPKQRARARIPGHRARLTHE